jgi:hypothetical protein
MTAKLKRKVTMIPMSKIQNPLENKKNHPPGTTDNCLPVHREGADKIHHGGKQGVRYWLLTHTDAFRT